MSVGHLVKRYFGSLRPTPLTSSELSWIEGQLLPAEFELWKRMTVADQRHSYLVGTRAEKLLAARATRPAIAAAILHDIGKVDAEAGTVLRVVATLVGGIASREQINEWSKEPGWLGRAGTYLRHNEIGEQMLKEAGSDPLTYTWAREHELVHTQWTLPSEITDALYKADNA